jgi:hypothetical protein
LNPDPPEPRRPSMFIVIYETLRRKDGQVEERPLAMFRNPYEANVFMEMLASNGRTAKAQSV